MNENIQLTEKRKQTIRNIVELVEDKDFPARRSILDYIEELFGYSEEIKLFVEEELKKHDK